MGILGICLATTLSRLSLGAELTVEDQVKAAILVKLTRFVEWPGQTADPSAPLLLCLLGETPLVDALDNVNRGTPHGRELRVLVIGSSAEHRAENCHILFLSESENNRLESTLARLKLLPILTVSDISNFAQRGGMIELVKEGNHMAFKINLKASRKTGIVISSQLLELATVIE